MKTARLAAPPLVIGAWLFIAASALAAAFGVGWRLRCWVCVFGQVNSESPSPSSSFSVLPSLSIPFVVIHASHVPFCRILLQFFPHFVFLFSSSFFVSFSRTFIRTFCFYFCIRQPFVKVDFFVCFPCNFCTYTFVFIFFLDGNNMLMLLLFFVRVCVCECATLCGRKTYVFGQRLSAFPLLQGHSF